MQNKKRKQASPLPADIALTLPQETRLSKTGNLLIQRGDLAKLCQFHYINMGDITSAIGEAIQALSQLEQNLPTIPEAPANTPKLEPKAAEKPQNAEPTIDIPLKKGSKTVKVSRHQITEGDTDEAAQRQAAQIAGKLIDGGLWDGQSLIRIDDVAAVAKKMACLTIKDRSLFTLGDFVQTTSTD